MFKTVWPGMLVCAVLLSSGCGGSDAASESSSPHTSPASTPSTSPSPSLPTPTDVALPPNAAVRRVALTRADLPAGFGPNQMREGDEVDGQVTLDLCSADFPSEELRLARHQVAFDVDHSHGVSNEVVAYEPGGVEQALGELRAAIRRCPRGFVPSHVAGVPDSKYDIEPLATQAGWQPGTLAFRVRVTARAGSTETYTEVFQPHGRLLSILYFHDLRTANQLLSTLATLLSTHLMDVTIDPNA